MFGIAHALYPRPWASFFPASASCRITNITSKTRSCHSMSSEKISIRARNIAIVGAGPSGVIAAKYLRAEKAFDRIVLFEQRSGPGGIWNYTGDQRDKDLFSIPQTNPRGKNQDPDWISPNQLKKSQNGHVVDGVNGMNGNSHATNGVQDSQKTPSFLSPMYANLETNIPRGLMGFQDLDWPSDSQLFPTHQTVLQYITDYGADVQDLVQYETQVINAHPSSSSRDTKWTIRTRNIRTHEANEEVFDALIVANGHFITPYVPEIEGIREWNTQHPGLISHSKYYRHPSEYSGKKTIVIGNSASGADISAQVCKHSFLPLLWSSKSVSLFSATHSTGDSLRKNVPPIARFTPSNRGVVFEDGSVESDIDAIIFATGYFYSLPFLENVEPKLITDGSHVNHTYQHLFFAPQPTLSFLALNQRVIPFPVAEAQASVLARVYAGRLALPSMTEMQDWEQGVIDEQGDGRNFHLLPFPKDGNYINKLSQWALSAERGVGLENDGQGKTPPHWGEWEFWCRENFPAIRRKFGEMGEKRKNMRSLEEVGFSFEEYKRDKARSEGKMI